MKADPVDPRCGVGVKIFTARNGIKKGKIEAVGCWKTSRFEFGRFRLYSQFTIKGDDPCFAIKGDSGSIVFIDAPNTPHDGAPVGMLYAGTLEGSANGNRYLACPIKGFFEKHGLSLVTH